MPKYNHAKIERKWQKLWEKAGIFHASVGAVQKKYYSLETFPYPSAAGLHVGHPEGYTAEDINARYQRMRGKNVLYTMGWDAFGLPTENYAIKIGKNPKEVAAANIANFKRQVQMFGFSYDWTREISTCDPSYYRWTQWLFLQFYKKDLAYRGFAPVNWCESCKTVLANEQVKEGRCERCDNPVVMRDMEQWFFKITKYAEELLAGLEKIDWPDSTKEGQRNWIGKSEGALLEFPITCHPELDSGSIWIPGQARNDRKGDGMTVKVFTTRPDTLFGATYMVLAPEHKLVDQWKDQIKNWKEVEAYRKKTSRKSQLERTELSKEKTGVELKGLAVINPATNEPIPVWIADYVLASYGTGAIMAVPAHDERDFEFAKKYNLPIREVVEPPRPPLVKGGRESMIPPLIKGGIENVTPPLVEGGRGGVECFTGPGTLMNSGEFDGQDSEKAKEKITKSVGGEMTTAYRLRDWLVSRQRYWGAPIPIVYDPEGQPHPVKEEHLPWLLPEDVDFKPTGKPPLASSKELVKRTEKLYGKGWRPEVETMDTFVDSSWYYYRYTDPVNIKEFASKKKIHTWMPVDLYIIGAEHTALHLLYARFFTKVLHELGYLEFDEPFLKLRHIGLILGEDGRKMSKRWGNVINPDDVVGAYGADAVRLYEMFMGPLGDEKPWNTRSILGVRRFIERVWVLADRVGKGSASEGVTRMLHKTVKKVTEDIEALKYNTAIAQMMMLVNEWSKEKVIEGRAWEMFLKILCPFTPHTAEELWERLGNKPFLSQQAWPKWDEKLVQENTVTIAVQVNGKVRAEIMQPRGVDRASVERAAQEDARIAKWTAGKKIVKVVVVPDRLVNIVVSEK